MQEGQVNALVSYSEVLYSLNKDFDALVEGLRAGKLLKQTSKPDITTKIQLINTLDQAYSRVQERNRLEGHINWVWTANFSTDGKKLISAGRDGKIRIWNRDGSVISTIDENSLWVSFSPNGQMIASINTDDNGVNPSGTMTLRKLDGTLLKTISSNGSSFLWGSFSPDGQKLAIANGDGTVKIWSIEGKLLNVLRGHQGPVNRVTFSPDGTMIASASQDKTIKLWKSDGSLLKTLQGHQGSVWGISFSPDSRMLASGGDDKTVRLWKIDGTLLDTFTEHKDWVWNVSFSPNGKLIASASADNTIRVWNLEGQLIKTLQGHKGDVLSVNFSPDDAQTLVSTGVDNTIRLWNLEDHVSSTVQEYEAYSPDGLIGVLEDPDNDKNVKLQNLLTGTIITLKGHQGKIIAGYTIFSPDGQILATRSEDKTIKIWQVDGTLLQTIPDQSNFGQIIFSPDNQILAIFENDNKTIKLWKIDKTPTGTRDKTPIILEDPTGKISNISFSPDSKTITTSSEDGIIRLWNFSGQPPVVLRGHKGKIFKVIFSPNGKIIASTGEDGTVRLWNLSGQQLSEFSEGEIGIEFDINPKTKSVTINKVKQNYPAWKEGLKEGDEIVAIDGKSISEILENDGISTNEMNEIKIFSLLRGKAGTSVKLKISSPYYNKNYDIQLNRSQIFYYTAPWILFGFTDTVPSPPPEYLKSLTELKKLRELKIIPEITPEQEYAETHPSKYQASYQNIEFSQDSRTIVAVPNQLNYFKRKMNQDGQEVVTLIHLNSFNLWDIKGNLLKILPLRGTYDLEQQKILVISQEGIQIWNFDGQLLKTLSGFNSEVESAVFSPDGKFIISKSADSESKNKTVKIWDLDGRLIKILDWSSEKNQIIYNLMITQNGNNSLSKYLDILLERGCSWTKDYIKNNSNLNDPSICNEFNSQSAQIESKPKSN